MRILNIIQCTNLGGMEQAALDSIVALRDAGHEVLMLSLHPAGELKGLADQAGIPLKGSTGYKLYGMGNILWLLKEIKKFKPDRILITGHNFGSLLASRMSGRGTYLSLHYHHGSPLTMQWKTFYAVARRTCQGIHFASRYIFNEVAHLLRGYDRVICYPYLFRDETPSIKKDEARTLLGIPLDAFVVGNAGWLIHRKAFDVFLQTAALVYRQQPEARFIIAGDGEERKPLEALAEQLGIREVTQFIGWQKDLAAFYTALDVLLFNSRFDALGRTPLEALCYGTPIVASVSNGGLDEFIRHQKDGFLIDQHNPEELAREILKLHDDPAYRDRMCRSGKARVLELGAPDVHLANLSKFLELE